MAGHPSERSLYTTTKPVVSYKTGSRQTMGFADVVWKDSGDVRRGRQYTASRAVYES